MFTKYLEPFWTALRQSYSGLQAPWQSVIIVRYKKHSACFCGQFEEDTVTLCLCHTAKKEEKLKKFQLEFSLICRNSSVHRNYEAWRSRRICFSQRIQVPLHQNSSLVNLCGVGALCLCSQIQGRSHFGSRPAVLVCLPGETLAEGQKLQRQESWIRA